MPSINYKKLKRKYPDISTRRAVARKIRRSCKKQRTLQSQSPSTNSLPYLSVAEEIEKTDFGAPHCFLLGAGASLAAFPNGDKNGKLLPVMKNFVEVLSLEPLLQEAGFKPPYDDFEAIYAELSSDSKNSDIAKEIEDKIYDYFSSLEIPDEPTLYDHLIISLRDKDVIASFNWDPFLVQAAMRNSTFCKVPHLFFLHGSVAIAVCNDCELKVLANKPCPRCGGAVERSKILYPVTEKNYTKDTFISREWEAFKDTLDKSYIFTIFGYGAPSSDVEAMELMSQAWGDPEKDKRLEEIELINVLPREELERTWENFIHSHHYRVADSFYVSLAGKSPRRSCEALWECLMEVRPPEGIDFPKDAGFGNLYDSLRSRLQAEERNHELNADIN